MLDTQVSDESGEESGEVKIGSAAVKTFRGPRSGKGLGWCKGDFAFKGEMEGETDVRETSYNSVQSPLKPRHNEGAKKGESGHTFVVDAGEAALKGDYEIARDKRVAAIAEFLKPVQTAATAL